MVRKNFERMDCSGHDSLLWFFSLQSLNVKEQGLFIKVYLLLWKNEFEDELLGLVYGTGVTLTKIGTATIVSA